MKKPAATAPDVNLGRHLIDQFVLVDQIGEGGMGAVYLADQPTMGRRAVVKLLHPQLSRDPQVAARFNLEARAAAALNHPHIVTVYNYGALPDGVLFLAMEHLDGRDLEHEILDAGRLSATRAVHIARQICDGLAEAHARGVVHRDLKPSNVMLVKRGREDAFVKLLDFGIAKVRGVALSGSGMIFGTPEYMSPEQLRGQELDGRSDVYALGVVLFEMLTGRLPFVGDTPEQLMTAHLDALPPTLSSVAPDAEVPRAVEALVARALAKDRAARPATADEMSELLAAAVAGAPATAVGGKRSDPPGQTRAPVGAREAGLRAALVGGIIAMLALCVLVALFARTPKQPRSAVGGAQSASEKTTTAQVPPSKPPSAPMPTEPSPPTAVDPTSDEELRGIEALQHEFLSMKSSLSLRDRRAALRSLMARIDAGGGSPAERARKQREALKELLRQHAN